MALSASARRNPADSPDSPVQVPFSKSIPTQWQVRVVGPRLPGKQSDFLSHFYTLHENNTLIGSSGTSEEFLPDMLQSRSGWWGGRAVFKNGPIQTEWFLVNSTLDIGDEENAPIWATDYARWLWQVQFSDTLARDTKQSTVSRRDIKQTTVSRLLLAYYLVRGPRAQLIPSLQLDQPVDLPRCTCSPDASDSHVLVYFAADGEVPFILAE